MKLSRVQLICDNLRQNVINVYFICNNNVTYNFFPKIKKIHCGFIKKKI